MEKWIFGITSIKEKFYPNHENKNSIGKTSQESAFVADTYLLITRLSCLLAGTAT